MFRRGPANVGTRGHRDRTAQARGIRGTRPDHGVGVAGVAPHGSQPGLGGLLGTATLEQLDSSLMTRTPLDFSRFEEYTEPRNDRSPKGVTAQRKSFPIDGPRASPGRGLKATKAASYGTSLRLQSPAIRSTSRNPGGVRVSTCPVCGWPPGAVWAQRNGRDAPGRAQAGLGDGAR